MLNTAFEGFLVCLTAIFRLSIFAAFAGSIFCLCDSVCVCVCWLLLKWSKFVLCGSVQASQGQSRQPDKKTVARTTTTTTTTATARAAGTRTATRKQQQQQQHEKKQQEQLQSNTKNNNNQNRSNSNSKTPVLLL